MSSPQDLQKELNKLIQQTYSDKVNTDNISTGTNINSTQKENNEEKINFDLLPTELEKYLQKYVIGQENAIATIATKICTHFQRMNYEKNNPEEKEIVGNIKGNILLIGPTGVGKTYIIKLIADYIGVPFVKADATKFSETGYVGGDVEDLVRELVRKANGNINIAEYGIIYLDEIDKIASVTSTHNPDISRSGVQRNLLKIMEESEVDLKSPFDIGSQMEMIIEAQKTKTVKKQKVNTKNILFVMSGAFAGLNEIISKRLNMKSVGFNLNKTKNKDYYTKDTAILSETSQEDLINFGFESEFVGRLPIITILDELDENGLYKILKNPNASVIVSKKRDFKAYDINVDFEKDALMNIARLAAKEKTGARSLLSIIEKKLIVFEKNLPATNIKYLTISNELIENPDKILKKILIVNATGRISQNFKEQDDITLTFSQEAIDKIATLSEKENIEPYEYCSNILADYRYGLKLLNRKTFKVTEKVLENNKEYLDNFIKTAYKNRKSV